MAIWHQGQAGSGGRHKEKLRAAAPLFLLSLPFSRRIHEKSVQGQTQFPGSRVDSLPPGRGNSNERRCGGNSSQKEGQNATETARDEGGRRAKKVESQVKRPRGHTGARWAGSSLQVVRCWESPQPHSSPETKAGGCKVWQFGLQVLVSIHHPSQPLASLGLCASAPWCKTEAIFPATSVCPSHHKGACDMGPLVPEAGKSGAEGWESGAPVPRLVGGGVEDRGERTMGGD